MGGNMKVRKNGKQRNVILQSNMYNEHELFDLYKRGYIFCLGSLGQKIDFETEYDIDRYMNTFRVPLKICKELKVRYNTQNDFYENIAITNDGMIIPVIL